MLNTFDRDADTCLSGNSTVDSVPTLLHKDLGCQLSAASFFLHCTVFEDVGMTRGEIMLFSVFYP